MRVEFEWEVESGIPRELKEGSAARRERRTEGVSDVVKSSRGSFRVLGGDPAPCRGFDRAAEVWREERTIGNGNSVFASSLFTSNQMDLLGSCSKYVSCLALNVCSASLHINPLLLCFVITQQFSESPYGPA